MLLAVNDFVGALQAAEAALGQCKSTQAYILASACHAKMKD
jgi:hypothetical protein